jgi:hypothetical protein
MPIAYRERATRHKENANMSFSPMVSFLIVLAIGAGGGLVFDHFAGPGWFKRQVVGAMPSTVTSALVGVAGAFVGFHLALSLALSAGAGLVGAGLGTAAVLFGWRSVR